MLFKYRKKRRNYNIVLTVITVLIICLSFTGLIATIYIDADNEAFETLHIQTKQIKDDLVLQIKSDNENLITMARFAEKLYAKGEDYSLMFDSFKPIGLFSRIGILTPDGMFTTKDKSVDISDKANFGVEALKGEYITGRTYSYTTPDQEIIRSAVPIRANNETVGIIYGVIELDTLTEKFRSHAEELDAKLFVYDKETGDFIIDTVEEVPGNFAQFGNRKYNRGYSFGELLINDEGFSSFNSAYTDEDVYVCYATIEDFNWGIMLVRYESQVFAEVREITKNLVITFLVMIMAALAYLYIIINSEKRRTKIAAESANIRELLLAVNKKNKNIDEALKKAKSVLNSRAAFYIDTVGTDYNDAVSAIDNVVLTGKDREYFVAELFKYASAVGNTDNTTVTYMCIVPDGALKKTNRRLYAFLNRQNIYRVSFVIISDGTNQVSILGVTNPKNTSLVKEFLEDTAVCFSIAVYNNNNLNKTERVALTDALTGVMNREAYKNDILKFEKEQPKDFSCIFIDVNELNLINNKYGHSAGDGMLIYIADSLKEVFSGHYVYRIGGDEFLVFTKEVDKSTVEENIKQFSAQIKKKRYTVSYGLAHRKQNINCEEIGREAEIKMYEAKAKYYQNKESDRASIIVEDGFEHLNTGIKEIDTMISILKEHYYGIFKVSLEADTLHRVLTPTYLGYSENEKQFSKLFLRYINDNVHPDYRRTIMSFLNFDVIKQQIEEGKIPFASFKTLSGESVSLNVYNLTEDNRSVNDTLWVFAKG